MVSRYTILSTYRFVSLIRFNVAVYALIRYDLDGWNPFKLYNNPAVRIHEIAPDYFEHKLYWIETDRPADEKSRVRSVDLETKKVTEFKIKGAPKDTAMLNGFLAVDEKYVYFVQKLSGSGKHSYYLLRARKSDGKFDKDFGVKEVNDPKDPRSRLKQIMILSNKPDDDDRHAVAVAPAPSDLHKLWTLFSTAFNYGSVA